MISAICKMFRDLFLDFRIGWPVPGCPPEFADLATAEYRDALESLLKLIEGKRW
jgi:hypothetical protein